MARTHDPSTPAPEAHAGAALGEDDRDLLAVLTLRVRTLSVAQAARTWWPEDEGRAGARRLAGAKRRLDALLRRGLIETTHLLAHPELDLTAPLAVWLPGLPSPSLGSIAHAAKQRWTMDPVSTTFITATSAGGRVMGGEGGRAPRTSEATHDLHVAAVFLRMRRELRTRAVSWRSEASVLASRDGRSEQLPDALVRDGRATTAIEFVGEYPAAKLSAFHKYCAAKGYGYELW